MKIIKYRFVSAEINIGTEENPKIEQVFLEKAIHYTEANEEIAKAEAYNGEYTIEEVEVPVTPADEDVSWDAMAEAIAEGVNDV